MARYIDADALIKDMRSRKYIDKALCEIFETIVDNAPTAYDLEAVVAELENSDKRLMLRNGNIGKTFYIPVNTAISIVRGKE